MTPVDPLRDAAQALRAIIDDDVYVHTLSGLAQFRANTLATARAALAAADTAPTRWSCETCGKVWPSRREPPEAAACEACGGRLAADGTTPTQPDEVLYEGPTEATGLTGISYVPDLETPPGTRVRVVATPATEDDHG